MDATALAIGAGIVALVLYKIITRPDPKEQAVLQRLRHVLNDPQYRVKGKYEE